MSDTERLAAAGQTAAAYAEKRFGGATRLIETHSVIVTGGATRILLNNPRRIFWMLFNTTGFNCYFGFDVTVQGQNGRFMPPFGGSVSMALDEDGEAVTYEVWCFSPGQNSALDVLEIMRK